ncbi:MAG: Gfo/Idh/MocA family oxidoreductase [Saprospiraceae bacterium]|nr:Gfo/Idh/MocA family oxidoreductase [Saprospiraceae bacterium]
MMDTPLYKYILVGCGAIAPRHIREILRTGTLTAVCDTDPERLSEYMTMYHVPGYASFDTLMSAGLTADIVVLVPLMDIMPVKVSRLCNKDIMSFAKTNGLEE